MTGRERQIDIKTRQESFSDGKEESQGHFLGQSIKRSAHIKESLQASGHPRLLEFLARQRQLVGSGNSREIYSTKVFALNCK